MGLRGLRPLDPSAGQARLRSTFFMSLWCEDMVQKVVTNLRTDMFPETSLLDVDNSLFHLDFANNMYHP